MSRPLLLVPLLLSTACLGLGVRVADLPDSDLGLRIEDVSLESGVSRDEAISIALTFWARRGLACGGPDRIRETPSSWVVSNAVGFGADPGEPIRISKKTGGVDLGKTTCFETLGALLDEPFPDRCRRL